jgi:DNA ligase-associated metallophosphoesterase
MFLHFGYSFNIHTAESPACTVISVFLYMPAPGEETIMSRFCSHTIHGEELLLLPEKAIWWPKRKILLLADVHLGKTTHFRQKGVSVPVQVLYDDIAALDRLVTMLEPARVIVLGDLFHAKENSEWQVFGEWVLSQSAKWELVKGNHDILPFEAYERYNITIYEKLLEEPPFLLTHFPLDHFAYVPPGHYVLAGHVHPAVMIKGKAWQTARVSCFYFGERQGLLPAFGRFTGNEVIDTGKTDDVFAIAGERVIKLIR